MRTTPEGDVLQAFSYREGDLFCEQVPLRRIAEEVGTPVYVYSSAAIDNRLGQFNAALSQLPHLICYSVKANANLAILNLIASSGAGFDIVSGGELYRVMRAGGDASRVVFSGVGKREDEIKQALEAGILMFNIESAGELETINRLAAQTATRAPISLRVNPDVDPKTHPYIATGLRNSKFGIPIAEAATQYRKACSSSQLEVVGVSCHIGSQLTTLSPFMDALERVLSLVEILDREGIKVKYLDMGGGLGIKYKDEEPPEPADYANAIVAALRGLGLTLVLEPGRSIVGNAGVLLTRILYLKAGEGKQFVIVDGAMNDLMRPALYNAYQEILTVKAPRTGRINADVVGPVCESGDFLAKGRSLPALMPGELLAVMGAGAYGFVMASNYNARPRPAEVIVDDGSFQVARRRESYGDLVLGETVGRQGGE